MTYDKVLDALGDPTRRLIFDRLRAGSSHVSALSAGLPISRPAVSQHLKILKGAGLVRDTAEGARRIYRIDRNGLATLQAWLDGLTHDPAEAYKREVQRQIDERRST